jgi:hypothetical protein
MTAARRLTLLQAAERLAEETATHWRVYKHEGAPWPPWRVVEANSETAAMRQVRKSVGARPALSTRQWRVIYERVGLPI